MSGPLAILNYIKVEDTVNQAGNFNATFDHNDHQSFIPLSHNWNLAQVSAVLNEIPSLMTGSHQTSTSPVTKQLSCPTTYGSEKKPSEK